MKNHETEESMGALRGDVTNGWGMPTAKLLHLYGKRFDRQNCFYAKFPYFWPLKVRLFGPDAEDVLGP